MRHNHYFSLRLIWAWSWGWSAKMSLAKWSINSQHLGTDFTQLTMVELWTSLHGVRWLRKSWFWPWMRQGAQIDVDHQYKPLHAIFYNQNIHETPDIVEVSLSPNFGKEKPEGTWCSNHQFNATITNFMTSSSWGEKEENCKLQMYIPISQLCAIRHSLNKCQHLFNIPNE